MMRTTFFLMCTILVVTACSATGERKPRQPSLDEMLGQVTEQNGRACIRINDIDGYAPLSDDMVSVSARGKKHYLVTTMFRCYSLGSSFGVAFSGAYSEVCGRGQGELITREEKCPIMHIYEFPSRDEAFASLQAAESRREAQALFPDKVEP